MFDKLLSMRPFRRKKNDESPDYRYELLKSHVRSVESNIRWLMSVRLMQRNLEVEDLNEALAALETINRELNNARSSGKLNFKSFQLQLRKLDEPVATELESVMEKNESLRELINQSATREYR